MSDDRVAELEKRVEGLEMQVRVLVSTAEEVARLDAETRALNGKRSQPPEHVDRADAVSLLGAVLRPMLAALPPNDRPRALAQFTPASAVADLAQHAPAAARAHFETIERHAREHSLTWDDLGVSA